MPSLLESRGKKPRTGSVKSCPECGTEFYACPSEIIRRVYCSAACSAIGRTRQVRTTCIHCGKEFDRAKSVGGKYCSRSCYTAERQPRKACKVCGTVLTSAKLTYCSRACRQSGRRSGQERPCPICGKPVYVQAYQTGDRYCSRACFHRSMEIDGPGARVKRADGYVMVYYPKHPDAAKANGCIMEHRLVMEQHLGRRLTRDEQVHHKDGVRDHNDIANLELLSGADHARLTQSKNTRQFRDERAELAAYRARFGPLNQEE